MKMKLIIERFRTQLNCDKQTVGFAFVINDNNMIEYKFFTLELPDFNNQKKVSSIPAGKYKVVKRHSLKYGNHFHILDVPERSYVLIHIGNHYTQTEGCILPGVDLSDINNDKLVDVVSSGVVMKKLNEIMPNEFELEIM